MAKLFIGISLVIMLATAALSFMLKGKVDALQADRKSAISKIADAQGQAKNAKSDAEKAQKEMKDAVGQLDDAKKQATDAQAKADDAGKQAAELKIVVDGKDKEIADLKTNAKPAVEDPRIAELTAKLADVSTQKDNSDKEAKEAKSVVDSLQAKMQANETEVTELRKKERDRDMKLGRAGLQAHILAVNSGWNFVVLNVGDKQGVSVDDPLLVVRGTEPVAKLRITSVEPSTSIADVLPGSIRRGTSVQPGDTVIFQGRTQATQVESKPSVAPVPPPASPPAQQPIPQ